MCEEYDYDYHPGEDSSDDIEEVEDSSADIQSEGITAND